MNILIWIGIGFLSGSLMFSAWLPKWLCGVDICAMAQDRNPGVSNAMKHAGIPVGTLCLLCDLGKGILPVTLSLQTVRLDDPLFCLVLAAPVAGHAFSPFRGFHGGKSIAVSFGVLLAVCPYVPCVWVLAAWYLFFSLILEIRPNSMRTCVTYLCFFLNHLLWVRCRPMVWGSFLVAVIVCGRHIREAMKSRCRVLLFRRTPMERGHLWHRNYKGD